MIFYDGSAAGRDGGNGAAPDPTKRALTPGQATTFANVSNYARGLNGVMFDFTPLSSDVSLLPNDFSFSAAGGSYLLPASFTYSRGGGAAGADRVTVTFSGNAVKNGWLQVKLFPSPYLGLAETRTYFFASLIGDTGDNAPRAPRVDAMDLVRTRNHLGAADADSLSRYDFNRDRRIDARDLLVVRQNQGRVLSPPPGSPQPATLPAPPPPAPQSPSTAITHRIDDVTMPATPFFT